jgi:hypothetical protein
MIEQRQGAEGREHGAKGRGLKAESSKFRNRETEKIRKSGN